MDPHTTMRIAPPITDRLSEEPKSKAVRAAVGLIPIVVHGAAALSAYFLISAQNVLALALAPVAYVLVAALLAGAIARLGLEHITPGRFKRDPLTRIYRGRMVYGAAWTSLYYCKPLLHAILGLPVLKHAVLRAFGYRGSTNITLYPDTWMRDLRLLDFGEGTYVANRVTLGTNMVMSSGQILVDGIRTGERVVIGHLAMVGPGSTLDERSEVGVAARVGMGVRVGRRVKIGPNSTINHGARIADDVVIGTGALIGRKASIAQGICIPAGCVVPDRAVLRTQADLARLNELAA